MPRASNSAASALQSLLVRQSTATSPAVQVARDPNSSATPCESAAAVSACGAGADLLDCGLHELRVGTTKAVDCLLGVTHPERAATDLMQPQKHRKLQRAGVLKLISVLGGLKP